MADPSHAQEDRAGRPLLGGQFKHGLHFLLDNLSLDTLASLEAEAFQGFFDWLLAFEQRLQCRDHRCVMLRAAPDLLGNTVQDFFRFVVGIVNA